MEIIDKARDIVSQKLINMSYRVSTFGSNEEARGGMGGIVVLVIAIVLGAKVLTTQMPGIISDWGNVTSTGTGSSWSASDKSTWNLGSTVLLFGTVLLILGLIIRRS